MEAGGFAKERQPNPNLVSPLPAALEGVPPLDEAHAPSSPVRHEVRGEVYWEILKWPETQQLITRILKGIMPISDIIRYQPDESRAPRFFSKELRLSETEERAGPDEINADVFILEAVFRDDDHSFFKDSTQYQHHNLIRSGDKYTLYDFEAVRSQFFSARNPLEVQMLMINLKKLTPESKKLILQKLDLIQERVAEEKGREFLESVLANIQKPVTSLFSHFKKPSTSSLNEEQALRLFQAKLLSRIEETRSLVSQEP